MNSLLGNTYKVLGKTFEGLTGFLILIFEYLVLFINSIKRILGLFSFIFLIFLFNPFLLPLLLSQPEIVLGLFILFVVPLLGKGLISYLKYFQYITTEYFYDKADFYLLGKDNRRGTFSNYGAEYVRKKREAERAESERRAREQQKAWEDLFRNYYEQARQQGYQRDYQGNYQGNYYGQGNGGFYNPTNDFIKKYEESCKILGLNPTTDVYEIKLAYRKMAKKYHPDLNKAPDATVKFQKINDANEFLSESNIQRYKQLKGK